MDNKVKELRKQVNKTMKELSSETGIGLSTISNYDNGYSNPKKDNAKILADYFGVSVPYLLGLDENPNLRNPKNESILKHLHAKIKKGTLISNKIDEWTPYKDDLAFMLADLINSGVLENYIDFISKDKNYNPVLLKAFKQFISDEEGNFLYLINSSGKEDSSYHYVWEDWVNSDEYKQSIKKK